MTDALPLIFPSLIIFVISLIDAISLLSGIIVLPPNTLSDTLPATPCLCFCVNSSRPLTAISSACLANVFSAPEISLSPVFANPPPAIFGVFPAVRISIVFIKFSAANGCPCANFLVAPNKSRPVFAVGDKRVVNVFAASGLFLPQLFIAFDNSLAPSTPFVIRGNIAAVTGEKIALAAPAPAPVAPSARPPKTSPFSTSSAPLKGASTAFFNPPVNSVFTRSRYPGSSA